MSDTPSPALDLTSDLAGLGGDLRAHAHAILKQELEQGRTDFLAQIEAERQHAIAEHTAIEDDLRLQMQAQRVAAGQQRNMYGATAEEAIFQEFGGAVWRFPLLRPLIAMARGDNEAHLLAMTARGGVHLRRAEGHPTPFARQEDFRPNPTRDQLSISNLLAQSHYPLLWSQNRLIHWRNRESHILLRGNFDTTRHTILQSLDAVNYRLAFAGGHAIHVLKLDRYVNSPITPDDEFPMHLQAANPPGGLAIWESAAGVHVYATEPTAGRIMLHTGNGHYGCFLDMQLDSRIRLHSPIVSAAEFTIEFWYQVPEHPNQEVRIPLMGGQGFPSLWYDNAILGLHFEWQFPDHPHLPGVEADALMVFHNRTTDWQHIALVKQDDQIHLYLNGIVRETIPCPAHAALPLDGSAPFHLGNFTQQDFSAAEIGGFLELRTWDLARTEAEIVAQYRDTLVAGPDGLPKALVSYHRFWGPGTYRPDTTGRHPLPSLHSGTDLARPHPMFDAAHNLGHGATGPLPLRPSQLFYQTTNPISDWVAADAGAGTVSWAERLADGEWYLMQASASGHLAPQRIQRIEAWQHGLVHSPHLLGGDILTEALQSEVALLRHGLHAQLRALHTAAAQVAHAYQQALDAIAAAQRAHAADDTVAAHTAAHLDWISRQNAVQRQGLDERRDTHLALGEALREAHARIREAERTAIGRTIEGHLAALRRRKP